MTMPSIALRTAFTVPYDITTKKALVELLLALPQRPIQRKPVQANRDAFGRRETARLGLGPHPVDVARA